MVDIKLLTADDAQAVFSDLVELVRDSVEHGASVGFVLPFQDGEIESYWHGVIADVRAGSRLLWASRDDSGRVLGSVQLEPAKKANAVHRAEVQKLLVHTAARRMGLGSALMHALEAEARKLNRTLLVLDTVKGSIAEPLYLKLGFSAAGVIPQYAIAPDRSAIEPTLYMYKVLS